MKILSIDCGIRTLSLCLLEIQQIKPDKAQEIFAKLSEIRKLINKHSFLKENQRLSAVLDSVFKYTYAKRFKIIIWKKIDLNPAPKCNKCSQSARYRKANIPFCFKHKPTNATEVQLTQSALTRSLVNVLDSIPELLTSRTVLIENQPSKNNKMKTVQTLLYSYFTIRGIIDAKTIKKVIYTSPKYKLRGTTQEEKQKINELFKTVSKKAPYAQRKEVSVKFTKYLLSKSAPEYLPFLDQHADKADDLCDSFPQGYSYPYRFL